MVDEKRKASGARNPIALVVDYEGADDFCSDYTENLSSGGTFVHTDRALEVDDIVTLQLSFPRLLAPLQLSGVVRWIRTNEEGEEDVGVGIEFTDFNESARAELSKIVALIGRNDPDYVQQSIRVLLVEDNPHVAALIRAGLLSGRYSDAEVECIGVSDGREALRILSSEEFDVLVIDVNLPMVDGPEVIAALRKDESHKSMPVIAVSAGGEGARREAMEAGANFFLEKPMRLREIFETMHLLLDGTHSK